MREPDADEEALDGNSNNVTQVLFTIHSAPANLFFKGQFWGRAALAPVDLSQDPGAFLLSKHS
jgi:hypothetical protein